MFIMTSHTSSSARALLQLHRVLGRLLLELVWRHWRVNFLARLLRLQLLLVLVLFFLLVVARRHHDLHRLVLRRRWRTPCGLLQVYFQLSFYTGISVSIGNYVNVVCRVFKILIYQSCWIIKYPGEKQLQFSSGLDYCECLIFDFLIKLKVISINFIMTWKVTFSNFNTSSHSPRIAVCAMPISLFSIAFCSSSLSCR